MNFHDRDTENRCAAFGGGVDEKFLVGSLEILAGMYLRFEGVVALTHLSPSLLHDIQRPESPYYDPSFPAAFQLTSRTKVWRAASIISWIEARPVARAGHKNSGDGSKRPV